MSAQGLSYISAATHSRTDFSTGALLRAAVPQDMTVGFPGKKLPVPSISS